MKPTESELEILQVLWENGPQTVRQVNDALNENRKVGYTTTLKIMQIMAEKELLHRDTTRRSHVYAASLPSDEVKSDILEHIVNTVFKGNRSSLVLQALGNHRVSNEELDAIRNLIEEMEGRNGRNVS